MTSPPPLAKKWNFVLNLYNEQAYYNQKVMQISLCMSSLQKWPPYLTAMTNENKNFKFSTFFGVLGPLLNYSSAKWLTLMKLANYNYMEWKNNPNNIFPTDEIMNSHSACQF